MQDRASGAAGRQYGLTMARGLARILKADKLSQISNEVHWRGAVAVIKCCKPGTDQIGVTAAMLPRLTFVLGAFEDERGQVSVWELDAAKFREAMYDSRSAAGARLQMIRRRYAEEEGKLVGHFSAADVEAAAI